MMQNLAQIIQLVRGRNPEQLVMSMLQNNQIVDPNIRQLIQFAQSGDNDSLVNLATSMFAQRGLDFNSEFQNFMSMLK